MWGEFSIEIRKIKSTNARCRHKSHPYNQPIEKGEEALVISFMDRNAIFCREHMKDVIEDMKSVCEEFYIRHLSGL